MVRWLSITPLGDGGIDSLSASVYVRIADTGTDTADLSASTGEPIHTAGAETASTAAPASIDGVMMPGDQRQRLIRPLAVYNPIHYQELPELFMDFVCSLTGKSPSTTGAGSEGALTKGPFNALRATPDLNNALVSYILTGYPGFSSSAGYIGRDTRVDHDISLLVPEIWARLEPRERRPEFMLERGYLEPLEDFEHGRWSFVFSGLPTPLREVREPRGRAAEDCAVELFFPSEVVRNGAGVGAGVVADVPHRRPAEAVLGEESGGGCEQSFARGRIHTAVCIIADHKDQTVRPVAEGSVESENSP